MLLNLLVAAFAFLAIASFAVWATVMRAWARSADVRVRSLASAQQTGGGLATIPFQQRVGVPFVEAIGRHMASVLPQAFVRRTERRLVLAGQPMRLSTFYTLMFALGAIFGGAYFLLIFVATDGRPAPLALAPGFMLGIIGMYLASFWLSGQAKARQAAMMRGLPDSMDLLTICVEAGLGLDAAFYRVVEKQSGPIVDEIRQMLREVGLGKSRRDALLDLAERTGIEDVRSFANAVIQAEQLGTSLAQVLRVQSQRMRVRRRQRAEQEARKAPVKMVFPLVFCLMPSLFIFILGPIFVNLVGYFSSR
ncbi:MAG: type II secretion system F family protein [Dehalococcoidia bacterium]|nr:type II secretion system F family protein [Dehalococcoidia bacterium]